MIETYAYARAGPLGNPSDGYNGKTISFLVRNFMARVLVYPTGRLEIRPSKANMPVFERLEYLYATTRWRGYYGGIRIIQALIDANFALRDKRYGISAGNVEMINAARGMNATANFVGPGGAINGCYRVWSMYQALVAAMRPLGVAVVKPRVSE
jgi:glucuronokinase